VIPAFTNPVRSGFRPSRLRWPGPLTPRCIMWMPRHAAPAPPSVARCCFFP